MAQKMTNDASSSGSSSSPGNTRGESVVLDFGRGRSSCGYCRSGVDTSISHGLLAHSLTVDDYQALLDRGWRRSGCFLYKPEMERTCCPSYTIRLKTSEFVPSKEQLRVSKRMQRFLDGTLDAKNSCKLVDNPSTSADLSVDVHNETTSPSVMESMTDNHEEKNKGEKYLQYLSTRIDNAIYACIECGELPRNIQLPKASVKKVVEAKKKLLVEGFDDLLYSSSISFQIAAALKKTGINDFTPKTIAEKLKMQLNGVSEAIGLSPKACNGHINFYSTAKQIHSKDLSEKNEKVTVCKRSKSSGNHLGKSQSLEIRLKRSDFYREEYELYRRYQITVHNDAPDHVTESSYKMFLVDSPLVFVPSTGDETVPPCGFGSFHQQYLINGRLVAVGVIDILPNCLSSKYLFWDPDFAFLSLGKYSALQEIGWLRENQVNCPSLQYYYLGYYIHSCNKMRYKAAYRPSELLCPLRYQWVPFDVAKSLLDRKKYVVLSDFATLQNEEPALPTTLVENYTEGQIDDDPCEVESKDAPVDEDEEMSEVDFEDSDDESATEISGLISAETQDRGVSDIMIGLKGSRRRYKDIQAAFGPSERGYLETQLHRYSRVVGVELSEKMVYSLG